MTILIAEPFTYSNGDLSTLNANWDDVTGSIAGQFNIASNAAVPSSFADDAACGYTGITWPNDCYAEAPVVVTGTSGSGAGIGPCVRMASPTESFYSMVCDHAGASNIGLTRCVTGAYATIGSRTQAFTDGALARLRVAGTSLTLWIDGVQLGAAIIDANLTTGHGGIRHSSTTTSASVTSFEGGDLAAGGGVTDGWKILIH